MNSRFNVTLIKPRLGPLSFSSRFCILKIKKIEKRHIFRAPPFSCTEVKFLINSDSLGVIIDQKSMRRGFNFIFRWLWGPKCAFCHNNLRIEKVEAEKWKWKPSRTESRGKSIYNPHAGQQRHRPQERGWQTCPVGTSCHLCGYKIPPKFPHCN